MDIHEQDAVKLRLRDIGLSHSTELKAAGRTLSERAEARAAAATDKKRAGILKELETLERARDVVLRGDLPQKVSPYRDMDGALFRGRAEDLKQFVDSGGDLLTTSALDAYVSIWVLQYRAGQAEAGMQQTPEADLRERRLAELDPECVEVDTNRPALLLAQILQEQMRQPPDQIRTDREWWELLNLVLCVESHDLSPEVLGLPEDLPLGGWSLPGDDVFGQRDGMRCYLDREEGAHHKEENDRRFWMLARRAADHLGLEPQDVITATPKDGAPGVSPNASDSAADDAESVQLFTDLCCFQDKGPFYLIVFGGTQVLIPTVKGLHYIRHLLLATPRPVLATDLIADAGGKVEVGASGAGVTDGPAMSRIRNRLTEVEKERTEANEREDIEHAKIADAEVESLLKELRLFRQVLGEQQKRPGQRVGQAIKVALGKIDAALPALGVHLNDSIVRRTSKEPVYLPKPEVTWLFEMPNTG